MSSSWPVGVTSPDTAQATGHGTNTCPLSPLSEYISQGENWGHALELAMQQRGKKRTAPSEIIEASSSEEEAESEMSAEEESLNDCAVQGQKVLRNFLEPHKLILTPLEKEQLEQLMITLGAMEMRVKEYRKQRLEASAQKLARHERKRLFEQEMDKLETERTAKLFAILAVVETVSHIWKNHACPGTEEDMSVLLQQSGILCDLRRKIQNPRGYTSRNRSRASSSTDVLGCSALPEIETVHTIVGPLAPPPRPHQ